MSRSASNEKRGNSFLRRARIKINFRIMAMTSGGSTQKMSCFETCLVLNIRSCFDHCICCSKSGDYEFKKSQLAVPKLRNIQQL